MRLPSIPVRHEPRLRRLAICVGVIVLLLCAARTLIKADDGDFALHRETGRRFLAGEFLYAGAHDFPYPPVAGLIFAPAALLPLALAKTLYYLIGTAALFALLSILRRLTGRAFSLTAVQIFWATALAVVLSIQFVLRDQAEAGFNTTITTLIWFGIYCWYQRRDLLGGASIGLAAAIKCTPALFIVYFAWKRQWKIAICGAVAAALFSTLPVLRQGLGGWSNHFAFWIGNAIHAASGTGAASQTIDTWQSRNLSLRRVFMNYAQAWPNETKATNAVQISNLTGTTARWATNLAILALFGIFVFWSARPAIRRDDPRVLWEGAAIGVLMILFSPVSWTQHCVALIPACYLMATLVVRRAPLPAWVWIVLWAFTLVCVLAGRDVIPRRLDELLTSLGIATFCIVGLFFALLVGPRLQHSR